MKTSELADWIADKDVQLHIGAVGHLSPLVPVSQGRTRRESDWLAYNLASIERSTGDWALFVNKEIAAFRFFPLWENISDLAAEGWEPVLFDGYGSAAYCWEMKP